MINKHQGVYFHLVKQREDGSALKILDITHPDKRSLYIFSEDDIFIMSKAADALVKDNHNPTAFPTNPSDGD